MSPGARAAAALLGAAAGPAGSAVLRRLRSPQPEVQAQYRAPSLSVRAQLGLCRHRQRCVRGVGAAARLDTSAARVGGARCRGDPARLHRLAHPAAARRDRQPLPAARRDADLTTSAVTADWPALLRTSAGWAARGGPFGPLIWPAAPVNPGYGDVRLSALLGMSLCWLSAAAPLAALFLALALVFAAAAGLLLRATGGWTAISRSRSGRSWLPAPSSPSCSTQPDPASHLSDRTRVIRSACKARGVRVGRTTVPATACLGSLTEIPKPQSDCDMMGMWAKKPLPSARPRRAHPPWVRASLCFAALALRPVP